MITELSSLHFLRPAWLAALLLLPLAWWLLRQPAGLAPWRSVCDPHLLAWLGEQGGRAGRPWAALLAALCWIIGCVALAGPAWEQRPQPLHRISSAHVLVLDLSRSMLATDLAPDRMTRARFKLLDLLQRLQGSSVGLVVFAGDAFVVSPVTDDAATLRGLVEVLEPGLMPRQGSRADLGLIRAGELLRRAGASQGDILLIADGAREEEAVAAAAELRGAGHRVSVLAVGTPEGAPIPLSRGGFLSDASGRMVLPGLERASLGAIASAGGGRYLELRVDDSDLEQLLDASRLATDGSDSDGAGDLAWVDRGPWLLLALVPLAALGFRRGWLWLLPLVLLPVPPTVLAAQPGDWWQRPDVAAFRALEQGEAAEALERARDPELRGAAAYRLGDYQAAEQAFAAGDSARDHYNRGNALAQQGRFEEALAAYDEALGREAEHADAQHNRQLLEQWLEQQPPPPQGQDSESDPSDDSEGDGEQSADPESGEDGEGQQSESSQSQSGSEGEHTDATEEPGDAGQDGESEGREQAESELDPEQREALERAMAEDMDAALEQQAGAEPTALEATEQEAEREAEQRLEQWLRRVPDDPGGLLRRKFQFEAQRRSGTPRPAQEEEW